MRATSAMSHPARRNLLLVLAVLAAAALAVGVGLGRTSANAATNGSFSFATTTGTPLVTGSVTEGQAACINIHRSQGTQGTQQVLVQLTSGSGSDVSGFVASMSPSCRGR